VKPSGAGTRARRHPIYRASPAATGGGEAAFRRPIEGADDCRQRKVVADDPAVAGGWLISR
jgi:hypothetical protein